jgi:enediyne biosynthesis protein E4
MPSDWERSLLTRREMLWQLAALSSGVHAGFTKEADFPVRFENMGVAAGLTVPTVYGGRTENLFILETTGCGAAFFDYDQDGWLDIFLVNGTVLNPKGSEPSNRLLKNNRDGTFTDVTRQAGLIRSGWGQGVCVGDFNNDGFDDLFVTYWGQNVLYRNNGDGTFTDVTEAAGLKSQARLWGAGCAFLDYDGDGHLDLFVTNYIDFDPKTAPAKGSGACKYQGMPVNCGPQGLQPGRNWLYRNNGDGTFSDVTQKSGTAKARPSFGMSVLVGDFDNDGRPDIYVANDSEPSYLFWNNGDGTFTESGLESGVATNRDGRNQSGMGVTAGDYNRDGLLDIFKTNFADDLPNLYRNHGKRSFDEETQSAALVSYTRLLGWGCGFFDCDNDGWPDILYVNGHVYPEIDQLKSADRYKQQKVLYQNQRNGKFRNVSTLAGPAIMSPTSARGCAFGDFNNDGCVDILINPINDSPELLRCTSQTKQNFISIKLVGTKSNRSAIGARVRCITGDHQQVDEVRSGGSFYSQSDLRIHFGLAKATRIDNLEIRWPSGQLERFSDVPVNRFLKIKEGEGKFTSVG